MIFLSKIKNEIISYNLKMNLKKIKIFKAKLLFHTCCMNWCTKYKTNIAKATVAIVTESDVKKANFFF